MKFKILGVIVVNGHSHMSTQTSLSTNILKLLHKINFCSVTPQLKGKESPYFKIYLLYINFVMLRFYIGSGSKAMGMIPAIDRTGLRRSSTQVKGW